MVLRVQGANKLKIHNKSSKYAQKRVQGKIVQVRLYLANESIQKGLYNIKNAHLMINYEEK